MIDFLICVQQKENGEKRGKKNGEKNGSKHAQLKIAKKMLKDGVDMKMIEKYTGLTKEELENM